MERLSPVRIKLTFLEYKELVGQFNNLVKEKDFEPLCYKDYRTITGKFCKKEPAEVLIELINNDSFRIIFYPGSIVIYTGNIFDLSFGTFIKSFFKEIPKEMIEKNNTVEKNNTYDFWGNNIDSSLTASKVESAISSTYSHPSDYTPTNMIPPDYDSLSTVVYSDNTTTPWLKVDKTLSRVDDLEEKVKVNEVKTKEEIDYIQNQLNDLSKKMIDSEYRGHSTQQIIDMLGKRVSKLEEDNEKIKCNKRKDNEKTMNTNKMFNFDFGFVDSNIRMSPYGMAVRNADGRYVSYDVKTGSVIDVEPFNFEGHRLMMKMPVAIKDVAIGDIVIHNHKPMFVVSTGDKITAIDIYNGEEKTILPTINMFNFNYITKVFSLFNFTGNNTPTAENPFGNIIPFMLMNNENMDMKDFFTMMAIANGGNMSTMFQNPMMMYMMFNSTTEMKEMLPFMMMSGAFNQTPVNNNHNCNCNNNGQN